MQSEYPELPKKWYDRPLVSASVTSPKKTLPAHVPPDKKPSNEKSYLQQKKELQNETNQQLGSGIASELLNFAENGFISKMRLAALEDLPQVSIGAPYEIAKKLLQTLTVTALWTYKKDYLVRATIARLARRYMMDHILFNTVAFFTNEKMEIRLLLENSLDMAYKQERTREWPESGVIVECEALKTLVTIAEDTKGRLENFLLVVKPIAEAVVKENPLPILSFILQGVQNEIHAWKGPSVMHLHKIVDHIYSYLGKSESGCIETALNTLKVLLENRKQWESLYPALSCLEWAIHRRKLTDDQINQLKRSLEPLTKASAWRLREKVASILIKLSEKELLSDLLETMKKGEQDKRVSLLFKMSWNELSLESVLNLACNVSKQEGFVGRVSEIEAATKDIKANRIVKMFGLPGAGKAALANQVASSLINDYDIVWKCDAGTTPQLSDSLKQLAKKLTLPEDDFPGLRDFLKSRKTLLLLVRLEHDLSNDHQQLLHDNLHVIITTTQDKWQTETSQISGLDSTVATNFVVSQTKRTTEESDIRTFCQQVACIPLALKIAITYLNSCRQTTVKQIIQVITKSPHTMDTRREENPSMMKLLQESVKKVTSANGKRLLWMIEDLGSDIPEQLYSELFARTPEELKCAKDEVKALSLIREDELHTISVHRFIQHAIHDCYPNEAESYFSYKVHQLSELFQCDEHSNLTALLSVSVGLFVNTIQSKRQPTPSEIVLAIHYLYYCLKEQGTVKAMTELFQKCITWWTETPPNNEKDYADQELLALCCKDMAKYKEAIAYMEEVIKFRNHGVGTVSLASSYRNLAMIYKAYGDLPQAQEYCEKALPIIERQSKDSSDHAALCNDLAIIWADLGYEQDPQNFAMKALEIRKKIGASALDLATSYNTIAVIHLNNKHFFEAEEKCLKGIAEITEKYGEDSHYLAASYQTLGQIYKLQPEKLEEAARYTQLALKIQEKILPDNHPDRGSSYRQQASIQVARKNPTEAKRCVQIVQQICKEAMFLPSPSFATTYIKLALIYRNNGEQQEAKELAEKALHIYEQQFSPDSFRIAATNNFLAAICLEQKSLNEAEGYAVKAVKKYKDVNSPNSLDLAEAYTTLAMVYDGRDRLELAKEAFESAVTIYQQVAPTSERSSQAQGYLDEIEKKMNQRGKKLVNKGGKK